MLRRWFSQVETGLSRLGGWIDGFLKRRAAPAGEAFDALGEEIEDEEPIATYQIPPHRAGLWVRCVSCGALHELVAICPECEQPLCQQTRYCRQHAHE